MYMKDELMKDLSDSSEDTAGTGLAYICIYDGEEVMLADTQGAGHDNAE